MSYEFVANMLRDAAGKQGMKFFPLVFSLFMFVLVANLLGMFPYFFTVTSHIIVTFCLAMIGHPDGRDLRPFQARPALLQSLRPERRARHSAAAGRGDRGDLLPVAPDQPVGASLRQHAGRPHHAEGVFGLRRLALARSASAAWPARSLPLGMAVALTGLEFLVAFLQAYVFAVLTCMYLNDAIHPGH